MKLNLFFYLSFLICSGCLQHETQKHEIIIKDYQSSTNPLFEGIIKNKVRKVHVLKEYFTPMKDGSTYTPILYAQSWEYDSLGNLKKENWGSRYKEFFVDSLGFLKSEFEFNCMYLCSEFISIPSNNRYLLKKKVIGHTIRSTKEWAKRNLQASNEQEIIDTIAFLFDSSGFLISEILSSDTVLYKRALNGKLLESHIPLLKSLPYRSSINRYHANSGYKWLNENDSLQNLKIVSKFEYSNFNLLKINEYLQDRLISEIYFNDKMLIDSVINHPRDSLRAYYIKDRIIRFTLNTKIIEKYSYEYE